MHVCVLCVCACVRACALCVCMRVCACVHACVRVVRACVRARVCVPTCLYEHMLGPEQYTLCTIVLRYTLHGAIHNIRFAIHKTDRQNSILTTFLK